MQKARFILAGVFCIYNIALSADLEFTVKSDSAECFGESTGKIILNIISGEPEFTIRLYDKKPSTKQNCLSQININEFYYTFSELPVNKYYITVEDSKGNYLQKSVEIFQPEKLKADPITIEKCFSNPENNDAILKANCSGGTKPYSYLWSENTGNQSEQLAKNITRGTYRCIMNDKNNCGPVSATLFFNEKVHKECFSNSE